MNTIAYYITTKTNYKIFSTTSALSVYTNVVLFLLVLYFSFFTVEKHYASDTTKSVGCFLCFTSSVVRFHLHFISTWSVGFLHLYFISRSVGFFRLDFTSRSLGRLYLHFTSRAVVSFHLHFTSTRSLAFLHLHSTSIPVGCFNMFFSSICNIWNYILAS